ncbi:hypothetical protein [Nostoc sp. 'Peltigera membranacea cyanobiont' 210A]|nr:hypothetical protein [Nostoc sp. 'Peltigera membranacea cyanobiont' 210A]
MGAEPQELGLSSDVYDGLRIRNLEFIVISQPPSHGDRFLSDSIESSPS